MKRALLVLAVMAFLPSPASGQEAPKPGEDPLAPSLPRSPDQTKPAPPSTRESAADPKAPAPKEGERRLTPSSNVYECTSCGATSLVGGKCPACDVEMRLQGALPKAEAKTDSKTPDAKPDEAATDAKARAYKDDNMAKGDYYFKTGYYLKASEAYRVAVLAEPVNPWKKLSFGHALFAIGNYSYASYALRRAVTQLDPSVPFAADVSSLFPSKRAFEKAVKDLKVYVKSIPRDPAGLSVLGYMDFVQGDDEKAREMFTYLQRLPNNDKDAFAAYFMKQLDARQGKAPAKPAEPELGDPKAPKPEVKPAPSAPGPKAAVPEASREEEQPAALKPQTAPARSE